MRQLSIGFAALLVLLAPAPSRAVFHFSMIDEVMSGIGADSTAQYVEIQMLGPGQTFVGHTRLTAFSCDGSTSQILLEVPETPMLAGGTNRRWLMATSTFQAAAGIAPDFTFPAGILTPCGMVCWGAPDSIPENPPTWDKSNPNNYTDCVAYGGYTGTKKTMPSFMGGLTSGTPTSLAPGNGAMSLTRVSQTNDNATDFALASPTPTNNAGHTGLGGGGGTTTTIAGATTTTTTTLACIGISTCRSALANTLPSPVNPPSAKARKVALKLEKLDMQAGKVLDKATTLTGKKQQKQFKKAKALLMRLLKKATAADAKGTLGVPLMPLEKAVNALLQQIP